MIEDVDGNKYLDFAIGSGSMSLGGANPDLVKVVKERVEDLAHASYPSMNEVVIQFAEKLTSIAPGSGKKMVAILSTGSEAADFAFRVSRGFKQRPQFLSFIGGHHGFSLGALAMSGHYAAMFRKHPASSPGGLARSIRLFLQMSVQTRGTSMQCVVRQLHSRNNLNLDLASGKYCRTDSRTYPGPSGDNYSACRMARAGL